MTIEKVADLKMTPGTADKEICHLLGYYNRDDGGGGDFYWDQLSTETSNDGTIFSVTSPVTNPGRWKRIFNAPIDIKWFGLMGDPAQPATTTTPVFQRCLNAAGALKIPIRIIGGTYNISSVTIPDNTTLLGSGTPLIYSIDQGLNLSNADNVSIDRLTFKGEMASTQTKCLSGSNISNLIVENCEFLSGIIGVLIENVTNGIIRNCIAHDFQLQPFQVSGANIFRYESNTSYNNGSDGLKLAGTKADTPPNLHKDIIVCNNICYNNGRDGFDIAGNMVENLEVYGNIFYNNIERGIDCKLVYQGGYMKNVTIRDNLLFDNENTGINCQIDVTSVTDNNVSIRDNTIIRASIAGTSYIGLNISRFGINTTVFGNHIKGYGTGIQIRDTSDCLVRNNYIEDAYSYGIWLRTIALTTPVSGNIIDSNSIHARGTAAIAIEDALITQTIIKNNTLSISSTNKKLSDKGTGTVIFNNQTGSSSSIPTVNGTKGDIIYNNAPDEGEPIGWVCVDSTSAGKWKEFGLIGFPSGVVDTSKVGVQAATGADLNTITYDQWGLYAGGGTIANTPPVSSASWWVFTQKQNTNNSRIQIAYPYKSAAVGIWYRQYDDSSTSWTPWRQLLDTLQKGSANGVATLDANAKLPISQLPALVFTSKSAMASANNELFVDSADNKLKFKDTTGAVHQLYV
ncbi:right-handed parallel beta-helix repeat-containing protein [Chitinophaga defluvii]|uniref:Right-handed parallel beta-helix repeat-containing protein n=1 Tax=Chitinophaga defluvii TaxID=3163343 RepID=A0ABV2T9N3_9BACT